jgi:hypothetical protein
MSRATAATLERSAEPSSPWGVSTAMKTTSASSRRFAQAIRSGEREPLSSDAPGYQLFETRLLEGHPARPEPPYTVIILIYARHPVPYVRQASSRRQPDVPRPDNTHPKTPDQCYLL